MEATGSAALRSRLAAAPVGGPGGRARVADPRSCPILSSRSCSRRSRSTSSGFRAAPCRHETRTLVNPAGVGVLRDPALHRGQSRGGRPGGVCLRNPQVPPPPHKAGSPRDPEIPPDHTAQIKNKATRLPRRKLDLGSRGRSLCPGLVGPGVRAGRTDAPGRPTNLGSPPPPCTEGPWFPDASKHSRAGAQRPRKELQGELKAGPGLKQASQGPVRGIFSKGCSSPGPGNGFTTKRPKGPTQMLPCLGWELEKAWTRCPMEERGPAGRWGRKRCVSPWGALPSSLCHPQRRRKGERPRERSVAWGRQRPRYLVGPGVVHRDGQGAGMRGAASVEERAAG